jgi:hypothetical protein
MDTINDSLFDWNAGHKDIKSAIHNYCDFKGRAAGFAMQPKKDNLVEVASPTTNTRLPINSLESPSLIVDSAIPQIDTAKLKNDIRMSNRK